MSKHISLASYELEAAARAEGYAHVCGADEAGAGPLMGPVYAAAVILPEGCVIEGLDDSKKLSEKKREALFPVIFLESFSPSISQPSGRMTAAAYTGPISGPAPASSTPQTDEKPAERALSS